MPNSVEQSRMYQIALEYERRQLDIGIPDSEEEDALYQAKRAEFEALRDLTAAR